MPDERTYGFSRDDAEALIQSIGTGENWFPETKPRGSGGGSRGGFITFQPYEVVPGIGSICDAVQAIVLSSECGSGIQPGDVVNVWDRSRSWFAMPEALLFASSGSAHYMKVSDEERYALGDLDPGQCRWEVVSMNCIEDDYGVS